MIQESLKLLAEFQDNASEGLKKLKANLQDLGGQASALKPLEATRAAESIRRVDDTAKRAARGGLRDLSGIASSLGNAFAGIGQNFTPIVSTVTSSFQDIGSAAADAATQFAATAAGFIVGANGIGFASEKISLNFKNITDEFAKIAKVKKDFVAVSQEVIRVESLLAELPSKLPKFFAYRASMETEGSARGNPELAARRKAMRDALEEERKLVKIFDLEGKRVTIDNKGIDAFKKQLQEAVVSARALQDELGKSKAVVFQQTVELLKTSLLGFAKAAGAAALAIGAIAGAISVAQKRAADDTAELAEKLGITVDRLEALKIIANETGTSVEGLQRTYDRLAKVLDRTDEESDRAAQSLANLGLSFEEIKKLRPEEAAATILQRYEDLGKSAEATAATQALLGQSFRESSIGIKETAKNIADYEARVAKYNAGESKVLAAAGAEQEQAFNNLALAFKGLGRQIAENTGPLITTLVQGFADLVNILRSTTVAGKIVNGIFSVINLVLVDFTKLLAGVAASLVAFFTGEFTQSFNIAKLAVEDFTTSIKNFGDRSKDTAAQTVAAAEAAAKAAEQEANAKKAAAQAEVERLKRAAAAKKAAEEQLKLFNDAKQGYLQQLGLIGATTEAEKLQFEIDKGRYRNLSNSQKAALVDLAQEIDEKNRLLAIDEKRKALEEDISKLKSETSLAEEELQFASLTSTEREKQVFLLRELNRLRTEGAGLSEKEIEDLRAQVQVLANRRAALTEAQQDAATISRLVDSSFAEVEKRVRRSIDLAKKLLEQRLISEVDYARFVKEQIGQLTAFNEEAAAETTEFWREAARGIQQSLSTFFFDFMQGKLTDLVGSFKRVIDQMVAQALAARLAQALFGTGFEKGGQMGGFIGQAASFLGGLFGGARAMGGPVSGGKAYLVGEKGPELAVFGRSGTVIPNNGLQNLGTNVNFTITAMDSQDVLRAMSKIKREAAGMFGDASNRYNIAGA